MVAQHDHLTIVFLHQLVLMGEVVEKFFMHNVFRNLETV